MVPLRWRRTNLSRRSSRNAIKLVIPGHREAMSYDVQLRIIARARSAPRNDEKSVPVFRAVARTTSELSLLPRHDARGEDGFEMFGAVAVGVLEVFVGDAAQLPAQF